MLEYGIKNLYQRIKNLSDLDLKTLMLHSLHFLQSYLLNFHIFVFTKFINGSVIHSFNHELGNNCLQNCKSSVLWLDISFHGDASVEP